MKTIITAKNNRARLCMIEVLNLILPKDPEARVSEVKRNLLALYSSLTPNEVYGLVKAHPPAHCVKVFPAHLVIKGGEGEIIRKVVHYFSYNYRSPSVYVDCERRGSRLNCRQIEIGIGMSLAKLSAISYLSPHLVIYINLIDDNAVVSFMKKGQEKVSVTPSDLNI